MNLFSLSTSSRYIKTLLFSLLFVSLLSGCNGKSPSSSSSTTNSSRSVSPTNSTSTDANNNDTDKNVNAHAKQIIYTKPYERDEEYPATVSLPMQYITASSGKKLAVHVTLPASKEGVAANGPFPVILVQTGYNMTIMEDAIPLVPIGNTPKEFLALPDPYVVKRGYVHVAVDVLGTGASEGGWQLIDAKEQAAYIDALDWVLKQPWSDGNIGLAGASYMAITALFTAAERPDAVKAIFADVPMGDAYRGVGSTGGMLNALFLGTWITITEITSVTNILTTGAYPELKDQIASATKEHINQIDSYYLPLYHKALEGDPEITYDGDFWKVRSPIYKINKVKAPTFITGANNCIFQRDEPRLYEMLKANNVYARLVMYDGDHISNFAQQAISNNKVGPAPRMMLQWFDKYLKGLNSGVETIPPVTQYVKGYSEDPSQSFAATSAWPHPKASIDRWYLHGDMTLTQRAPSEEEVSHAMTVPEFEDVSLTKSKGGQLLNFSFNPKDGTRCSISSRQWTLGVISTTNPAPCYADSTELEQQESTLNFETAPFSQPYYINGPIQADVWIDTSVTEAVLSVRVDEVAGDGSFVKPLTDGLLLASARAVDNTRSRLINNTMVQPYHPFTQDAELPVMPGEVMKMQVEIFPTSALIRVGNKLRISIAPSNQAQGVLNNPRKEKAIGGVTTVHIAKEYPSSVVLPIVPLSELN